MGNLSGLTQTTSTRLMQVRVVVFFRSAARHLLIYLERERERVGERARERGRERERVIRNAEIPA